VLRFCAAGLDGEQTLRSVVEVSEPEVSALRPLEDVLRYENAEVVYRFSVDHGVSLSDAEEIFTETKKWLWLCAAEPGIKVPLLGEARAVDEMWHTFLLFTEAYANFCDTYLGFFVHHQPRTRAEKEAYEKQRAENSEAVFAEQKKALREAYEIICDRLGTDTLRKWCEEFPARFTFDDPK
jgi:hypothetical protein